MSAKPEKPKQLAEAAGPIHEADQIDHDQAVENILETFPGTEQWDVHNGSQP